MKKLINILRDTKIAYIRFIHVGKEIYWQKVIFGIKLKPEYMHAIKK